MTDYQWSGAPWYSSQGEIFKVVVEENVTSIGEYAFCNCTELTSVTIGSTVGTIGSSAFSNCGKLAEIVIPDGVTEIGMSAFHNCEKLATVTIPDSVDTIGGWAFASCYRLTELVLPDGVTSIGDHAFYCCTQLASITIPASVTSIGEYAFSETSPDELIFGHRYLDSLTIGSKAFEGVYARGTTICVPSTRRIHDAITGTYWYNGWESYRVVGTGSFPLQSISIQAEDSLTQAEVGVPVPFSLTLDPLDTTDTILWTVQPGTGTAVVNQQGVLTGLTEGTVTLRAASKASPELYAEQELTILPPTGEAPTALTLTAGGTYANEVEAGATVPMVLQFTPANTALRGATWEVQNGTGTAEIDQNGNLTGLTPGTVTVYAESQNDLVASCTVNVVRYVQSVTIYLDGKDDPQTLGLGEGRFLSHVLSPEDSTTKTVTWSVLPGTGNASLVEADRYGYYDEVTGTWQGDGYKLTGTRPGTVTVVAVANDSRAVTAQMELIITDTIRPYPVTGGNIYYNTETGFITGSDSTVTDVIIPSQIEGTTIVGIGPEAFANYDENAESYDDNTTLTSVSIPATVREIGRRAFCRCVNLATLRFASDCQLTTIGEVAFSGCRGLTSLTIPTSVVSVGTGAFNGLSALKHLTIPGEMNCENWLNEWYNSPLETLTLTGTRVCSTGYFVVEGYTYYYHGSRTGRNAKKVIIADTVTAIDDNAFVDCDEIQQVVLGADVASIGEKAFYDCDNLTAMNIPDSLRSLGKDCFENCGKLTLLDLSAVPENIVTNDLCLTDLVEIPTWMKSATAGQAQLSWGIYWTGESSNPYEVADYYRREGKYYLSAYGTGTITLFCEESYTGLETFKTVTVEAGLKILPDDFTCLTSGQSKQLTARLMPDGTKVSAYWHLDERDKAFATLTSSGKLTAKAVTEPTRITVNAISDRDGAAATKTITILPKAESIALTRGGEPVTGDLVLDMQAMPTLALGAEILPAGALDTVTWASSDKKIATVDENGEVTLLKPGAVTITATAADGSKKAAKVKLTVYYVDEGKTITATSDVPTQGLEPGQTAQITVRGSDEIPASQLIYSIPDNQQEIATVDENGIVTAGTKPGTATVTITLDGDPLKRKATCKVKVIAMQAVALELSADVDEAAQVKENAVILDAKNVSNSLYTFAVSAQAMDYASNWADTKNVTWASGNTAIATVKANKDGTATVTVKKGASGECAITATAKDLNKVTATLWLSVRDYAPRLETTSPAMNLHKSSQVDVALLESYDNTIDRVSIDSNFDASWEDGTLTITALEGVKKGTYTQTLKVDCANGETYDYTLKIKVTETAPTVTVKQSGKYNLFYNDGTATLNVSVKGEVVENVTVLEGDFDGAFENGTLTLTANSDGAPGKKVKLEISVTGYEKPVEKTVNLSTVTTAPKLKLSATSSVINLKLKPEAADRFTTFQVLNGKDILPLEKGDIAYSGSFATHAVDNDTITLTLIGEKGGTATLNIKKSNWTKAVKLTHKVTVQTAMPTLKLGATTLKLNSVFPEQGAATTVSLSQGNLTLSGLEITSTAKEGTALAAEAEKLSVDWDGANGITATIEDGTIKTGTYAFSCVGTLETGETLKAVTLKVTVSATNPKVKLASTTFKLNRYLAGEEYVSTKVTIPTGYTLEGFAGMEDTPLSYDGGLLTACLSGEDDLGGTYTIYPVLMPEGGWEPIALNAGLKVKIATYHSSSLSATVTTKGKLDTLNPDSAITCTIKLKNCTGPIEGVSLSGQDGDLFFAQVDEDGKIIVKLLEGQEYATNKTYKVTLDMTVCGQTVSKAISFKVTQSALKVTAIPATVTCYQAIGYGATTLKLTSPATAEFADAVVSSKTTAAFQKALGEDGLTFHPETGRIAFHLAHPGLLAPGKSYTLYLDVTPKNAATNVKPTQVKLTIKVQK